LGRSLGREEIEGAVSIVEVGRRPVVAPTRDRPSVGLVLHDFSGGGSERIVGAVGMMVREGQDAVPYAVPREHAVREPVQSASGCHQNPTDLSAG